MSVIERTRTDAHSLRSQAKWG